jgi:hypothetical protein
MLNWGNNYSIEAYGADAAVARKRLRLARAQKRAKFNIFGPLL